MESGDAGRGLASGRMRQKEVIIAMICRVPLAYWKMRFVGACVSVCVIALCVHENIDLYTRLCMEFLGVAAHVCGAMGP
jgi:hypothetical protein